MTKKHFVEIARILYAHGQYYFLPGADRHAYTIYSEICGDIADYLASQNPRFNRDKFLIACGFTN